VGREEVDQINIVARWISHHSEDTERAFFSLPAALDQPDEIAAFAARVAAIVCAPAPDVAEDDNSDAGDEGDVFAEREPAPDADW
jgi:hypothetical protein